MSEYLTTAELADLLRIKERKVYDLAASGTVPCTRATGKLLFPRDAVEAWLDSHRSGPDNAAPLPSIFLGSHDPLLDWALRESRSGIAGLFDSSRDGLARFAGRGGLATGLHIPDPDGEGWNAAAARDVCAGSPSVLIHWAKRQRGLILSPDLEGQVTSLADLQGRRIAARQPEAGAQIQLDNLIAASGLSGNIILTEPVRSEAETVQMVQDGKADAAFGLESLARQFRLGFVALVDEEYDLLVDRYSWFEEPLQTLFAFCRTPAFAERAESLGGYDIAGLGTVRLNGP